MAGFVSDFIGFNQILSDVAGFSISIFAIYLGRKEATVEFSYGWARAEIIGALTSVVLIWALTLWLVVEAIDRIRNPSHVDGYLMLYTAIFGLFCNIVMAKTLHGSGGHSHGGGGGHGGHGGHGGGEKKKEGGHGGHGTG